MVPLVGGGSALILPDESILSMKHSGGVNGDRFSSSQVHRSGLGRA